MATAEFQRVSIPKPKETASKKKQEFWPISITLEAVVLSATQQEVDPVTRLTRLITEIDGERDPQQAHYIIRSILNTFGDWQAKDLDQIDQLKNYSLSALAKIFEPRFDEPKFQKCRADCTKILVENYLNVLHYTSAIHLNLEALVTVIKWMFQTGIAGNPNFKAFFSPVEFSQVTQALSPIILSNVLRISQEKLMSDAQYNELRALASEAFPLINNPYR